MSHAQIAWTQFTTQMVKWETEFNPTWTKKHKFILESRQDDRQDRKGQSYRKETVNNVVKRLIVCYVFV